MSAVLTSLGALHAGVVPLDRRAALRFAVGEDTSNHLIAAVGESFWPARVRDISTRGISLHVRRRFETGQSLIVELANGVRVFSCALVVRIAHVSEQEDGSFVLGAEFARKLSYNELMALLS